MPYILKHFDTELLRFDMGRSDGEFYVDLQSLVKKNEHLLPHGLTADNDSLKYWLKHRRIPRNRAYVESFLARQGLNERDTAGIIALSKGLSLSDSYWICNDQSIQTFNEVNLFDNPFSRLFAETAFTGYGSQVQSRFHSSPEFTTGGMLAKCWRRINGDIVLYKSGTEGAGNTGNEPYSEYYASQIAGKMGLNFIEYGLARWKGRLCSTCLLFTSKERSYVPAYLLIQKGGISAALEYYKKLDFQNELLDMLLFDAIICNEDRHFGNFGFIVDSRANKIVSSAPIFDNGISLFCYAMEDVLDDLQAYSKTRLPNAYDDFISFSREHMTKNQREMLHKLHGFHFKRHPRYNLTPKRLKAIEQFIQARVNQLLS